MVGNKTEIIHLTEISMQFGDSDKQQVSDSKKIMHRCRQRGVHGVCGTEAGAASNLKKYLADAAESYGYKFWMDRGTDTWYAVSKDWITGGWDTWSGPTVIPAQKGRNAAKKPTSVSFMTHNVGRVSLMAGHFMTKGRPVPQREYSQNLDDNRRLAKAFGDRGKVLGAGKDIVFYLGDQNIVDRTHDTFLGQANFTSVWDELGKWPNTGHGNIDIIASYNPDVRVKALYARALPDSEFHLFTDHFMVEAGFAVRRLA